ncbi:hypothetical protein [Paracoccus siganidrum]|uniref:DUF2497 domain-containing protein n=1 Tax=Paracoccus siganidrum TaxID=1276757 RepID=A0A419A245_9RHOB|nr:hypothetical protein [Paracoccus siganidrum]RJL07058.1 hypothetical protein D3P05_17775 [Paracoccus siganidrum]RMC32575.1 hypothetical protein C9E82_14755 [Paracoccus siganidrum]
MADPRRIIPTRPSAQRLSDDIGDVLTAIRRLIAEDEALVSARDRVQQARGEAPLQLAEVPISDPEDPAELLARRYGGNAALARQLAHLHDDLDFGAAPQAAGDDAAWPLGPFANSPEAARPGLVEEAPVPPGDIDGDAGPGDDFEQMLAELDGDGPEAGIAVPEHRNDLARRLSATFAGPEPEDAPGDHDVEASEGEDAAPLLLDPNQRITSAPLPARHAPRPAAPNWTPLTLVPAAQGDEPQDAPQDEECIPDPAAGQARLARVDFEDDFDWKARMRPDLDEQAAEDRIEVAGADLSPLPLSEAVDSAGTAGDEPAPQPEVAEAASDAARADAFLAVPMTTVLPAQPFAVFSTPFTMATPLAAIPLPIPPEPVAVMAPGAEPVVADMPAAGEAPASAEIAAPDAELGAGAAEADLATAAPVEDRPAAAAESPAEILSEEEQSIRELLREMIQEELLGELGQRFSRNLRAVIRREVAVAIDDHLDRL